MRQPTALDITLFVILLIWQLFWRGMALWKSAQYKQKKWFIAFIVLSIINTAGIVEIIYLARFAKERLTIEEVKGWFSRSKSK